MVCAEQGMRLKVGGPVIIFGFSTVKIGKPQNTVTSRISRNGAKVN